MSELPPLGPETLLLLFMMTLAVVPLTLIWLDDRRRVSGAERLRVLRAEAVLAVMLAQRAAAETPATARMTVPGA